MISFFRPVYKDIFVTITIKALYGYTVELEQKIKQNVEEYLNGLRIGDNLSVSAIWGVSLYAMQDLKIPSFSIVEVKAGTENENQKAQDIEILFQEVTRGRKEKTALYLGGMVFRPILETTLPEIQNDYDFKAQLFFFCELLEY